ncbi:hypothetical protein SHVI106290_04170 [Shewanella violacea]
MVIHSLRLAFMQILLRGGEYNFVIAHPVLEARSPIYTGFFSRRFDLFHSEYTLLLSITIYYYVL